MFRSLFQCVPTKSNIRYIHQAIAREKVKVQYIRHTELFPGQSRCSLQNVSEVMKKMMTNKNINGSTLFPDDKPFSVLKAHFGYVLVDGHHEAYAAKQIIDQMKGLMEEPMIPIVVIKDLSHLDTISLWKEADKNNWAYLYDKDNNKIIPPRLFTDLVDDPNRYFAAITARKYRLLKDGTYNSWGAEYPLWLKVLPDTAFIEFIIANALYAGGFSYNPNQDGGSPGIETIEKAREILLASRIEGLRIAPAHSVQSEINIVEILSLCETELNNAESSSIYRSKLISF